MFDRELCMRLIVVVLTLALAVSGCANFPPNRATEQPLPTDTPLPRVTESTSTPTPLPPLPTSTHTAVVVVVLTNTPQPTPEADLTDTPQSTPEADTTDAPQPTPGSTPTPLPPSLTPPPQSTELLTNGNFEEGFGEEGVAIGWNGFSNGDASFGWQDDTWEPVVWEGEHSQLLFIIDPSHNDRYIGIYQTVKVVPGEAYELTLRGLVRASTPPKDYGHRLYWGVDYNDGTDWQAVENWLELPWDQQPVMAEAFTFDEYTTIITPTAQSLTLFIRGHSKWPRQGAANFNLDGVSLEGVPGVVSDTEPAMPVTGRAKINWLPIAALIVLLLIFFREGWRSMNRWHEEKSG